MTNSVAAWLNGLDLASTGMVHKKFTRKKVDENEVVFVSFQCPRYGLKIYLFIFNRSHFQQINLDSAMSFFSRPGVRITYCVTARLCKQ